MPLIALGTRFFSKRMHRRYQAVQAAFSDLTEVVRERFAGIRIIKAHAREAMETNRVQSISETYVDQNVHLARTVGVFFPMIMLLANLSMAIVLYFGGRLTIDLTISAGDLVAFISYLGLLTWPMMALGWVTNLIQRGRASLDRIADIFNTPVEIVESPHPQPLESVRGNIRFEDVSFAYPANGGDPAPTVLHHIDLTLPAGRILGIVGPPGCGKTTLINLIPRLYDPTAGRVLLDGMDIRKLKLGDLRDRIAFMPQEPFMFARTVRDNIGFGDSAFTQLQIENSAKAASLLDTVKGFQDGFDTLVGEKGVILSGGQKQRIALARCLMKRHSILILDDPISQVDFETGAAIIATLKSIAADRTIIIVSHRMSAVRFADRIISLENGRIVESGSHEELVQSDRYYGRTFRLQELEEGFYAS
jgi:ATP-binding cassette subfamily B protein